MESKGWYDGVCRVQFVCVELGCACTVCVGFLGVGTVSTEVGSLAGHKLTACMGCEMYEFCDYWV